jgi:hypothetical protein
MRVGSTRWVVGWFTINGATPMMKKVGRRGMRGKSGRITSKDMTRKVVRGAEVGVEWLICDKRGTTSS